MNAHHDNAPLYRHFTALLHRTMGLDASSLGLHAIERAVDQHVAGWRETACADATLADYWNAVQASPALLQALIETLTVPETWFFRDADAFRALARLAHERLDERLRTRGHTLPLRILSLPCSTGEEPYTIAMALFDAGLDAAQFRIDAMDINERSLALAQRAHYGRNSFRGNALAFRDAHFSRTEDGWRLAPRIVDTVRFAHANLMQLDAAALGVYDFVFCRNVLIYFDRDTQQIALQALNSVLADGGTLFVGPAETGLLMRYGMQSAKIPLAFAFHRAAPDNTQANGWHTAPLATAAALAMTPPPALVLASAPVYSAEPFAWPDPVARNPFDACTPQWAVPPTTSTSASTSGAAAQPRWSTVQAAPQAKPAFGAPIGAASVVRGIPAGTPQIDTSVSAPGHAQRRPQASTPMHNPSPDIPGAPLAAARDTLRAAHDLADAGRLDEAAAAVNAYLEQHAPYADAFYLLGVLADANGETNVARGQYRKALYLDPQHAEALAHLAALLELEGDRDGARLLMQRASRAQGVSRA
ncbi:CheR family methyltransferase [Paraburkholderia antibiotica]|uniref:Chemotaxis protein CheR n=1 Tax=Paraburkholderia antibiotica TaxID=2728839 RepID=A0A7X9ZZT6_9BURK|nr:CheR family methyltransferase [Paraburkholderia antibiotica]NML33503.1 chemotaxis protein CheR [Paraburkholderia antibiotica]